jgi:hypothetical protein
LRLTCGSLAAPMSGRRGGDKSRQAGHNHRPSLWAPSTFLTGEPMARSHRFRLYGEGG